MRELPKNQLDPKIKNVWRLNDVLWLTVGFLFFFVPFIVVYLVSGEAWSLIATIITAAVYVLGLIIWVVILPPIRFMRWRYELSPDYLEIALGIIWRKHFVIPFVRVQNTDTRQGPIMRAFGLSSVTVATAAGEHEIPGLKTEVAAQVRDKAAELARIAQEDI